MKTFLLSYFLFSFFFLSFFSSGFVDSQDGLQYVAVARRLYYDHTLVMPEANYDERTNIHMNVVRGHDGNLYGLIGLGYIVAMLPAVVLEDLFLHITGTAPLSAFPLENDWPVLLFASMTNSFFGAILIVVLYLYLRAIEVNHKAAAIISLILFTSSNLFPYSKHVFAHMIFSCFTLLTFYLLKQASLSAQRWYMLGAGISFGIVTISYNETFGFVAPILVLYYLLLNVSNHPFINLRKMLSDAVAGLIGYLPFIFIYLQYNALRLGGSGAERVVGAAEVVATRAIPAYVIFEGIWGLLFSPGKSVLLFSPLLLLLLLSWFKLPKKVMPELIAATLLFAIYLWMIGTFLGGADYMIWHGDSSWGPRYMLPTLPLLLVLVGYIISRLQRWQLICIVAPLLIVGLGVQLTGVLLPYQVRFRGMLGNKADINGRQWDISEFGNLLPRYSPVFNQSKLLVKRIARLPAAFSSGLYRPRLIDGFGVPYEFGDQIWRGVYPTAVITFNHSSKNPSNNLALTFRNHQITPTSTASAYLTFAINGVTITPQEPTQSALVIPSTLSDTSTATELQVENEQTYQFILPDTTLSSKNTLQITSTYPQTTFKALDSKQVLFLQSLTINGLHQNISLISYPYVSAVGQSLTGAEYIYWGKEQSDPWSIWHMHSGVYENTFDLWWLRPFHYWDLPKDFFIGLFVIHMSSLVVYGYIAFQQKMN